MAQLGYKCRASNRTILFADVTHPRRHTDELTWRTHDDYPAASWLPTDAKYAAVSF